MLSNLQTFDAITAIRAEARPLATAEDYEGVVSWIGDATLVLLGGATQGTQDFYEARARITRLLIENHGFSAVAIESDWSDTYRVNRYVAAANPLGDAADALGGFESFPTWLWRNRTLVEFIAWLRERNAREDSGRQAGFYGLDLYSSRASMQAVIAYLERLDPSAAAAARDSYACFDQPGFQPDACTSVGGPRHGKACEDAVTRELLALRERQSAFLRLDGPSTSDDFFYAQQHTLLARDAERYYRTMVKDRAAARNLRATHLAKTLQALRTHLDQRGQPPKIIVWAHNAQVGDARGMEPGERGELNLGQLVRQGYPRQSRLIGLFTHDGTVIAASDWNGPAERKVLPPAIAGSYEALFHQSHVERFFLPLEKSAAAHAALSKPRLERVIGAVYHPETERIRHYVNARLSRQFDAVIHFDNTHALEPLDRLKRIAHDDEPYIFASVAGVRTLRTVPPCV